MLIPDFLDVQHPTTFVESDHLLFLCDRSKRQKNGKVRRSNTSQGDFATFVVHIMQSIVGDVCKYFDSRPSAIAQPVLAPWRYPKRPPYAAVNIFCHSASTTHVCSCFIFSHSILNIHQPSLQPYLNLLASRSLSSRHRISFSLTGPLTLRMIDCQYISIISSFQLSYCKNVRELCRP